MFTCPECKVTNDAKSWNDKTMDVIESVNIQPVEDRSAFLTFYYCPNCGEEIDGLKIIEEASNT